LFRGKVLFCTGGGSGICRGMTEAMMSHGADAMIVGRKVERLTATSKALSSATGKTCIFAQADVRQPAQLQNAVKKCIEKFGRIDFVICGAAGNFLAPISGLSENAFRTVNEIDTLGTFHTVKATLPHLRKSHGAYIHVSATLHYQGIPFQAHVSAAKAAVDALSRVIAVEEGPRGIRSNVIAPGGIQDTEGMSRLSINDEAAQKQSLARIPLQRHGKTQDINNATLFLFSQAANWITGQVLVVDGGHSHLDFQIPYPQAVMDPGSVEGLIKARM